MKVILLRDVARIGRKGQVVEVPDGYALNQLIPKKSAEAATAVNLKRVASLNASTAQHDTQSAGQFAAVLKSLEEQPLLIPVLQVNEQNHLFKAIGVADIIAAATGRSLVLLPVQVIITAPIKSLGQHAVIFKHGAVEKTLQIEIVKK